MISFGISILSIYGEGIQNTSSSYMPAGILLSSFFIYTIIVTNFTSLYQAFLIHMIVELRQNDEAILRKPQEKIILSLEETKACLKKLRKAA